MRNWILKMLWLSDIIWAFWGSNCTSNFAFFRPFLFWKGICKVHRCSELKILVPKHLWKSKIGPLQLILATKHYVTFFLGHPVLTPVPVLISILVPVPVQVSVLLVSVHLSTYTDTIWSQCFLEWGPLAKHGSSSPPAIKIQFSFRSSPLDWPMQLRVMANNHRSWRHWQITKSGDMMMIYTAKTSVNT